MPSTAHIVVVAGCAAGRPEATITDTLAFADRLRALRPGPLLVLLLGDEAAQAAQQLSSQSGFDVLAISVAGVSAYTSEVYRQILAQELATLRPAYVCVPHTAQAMEWAPALAAAVGADCVSGVDAIERFDGRLCFQKDLYGGKVKGRYSPQSKTTILTVQPGAFKSSSRAVDSPGEVRTKKTDCPQLSTEVLGVFPSKSELSGITEAKTIVAAGNGIGAEENMALIHRLADLFPRSAVAGTRLVCDRGWLSYQQQIGITGATVAPALYIACGISGASQHRVGMCAADFVVAINTDPNAAIFNEADICIVEDLIEFIPLFVDAGHLDDGGSIE